MHRTTTRLGAALLACALIAAACGDDDGDETLAQPADCYYRVGLVVAVEEIPNPADFGLQLTEDEPNGGGVVFVYTTENDPLVASLVVTASTGIVVSPVHAVSYNVHWSFLPGMPARKAEMPPPEGLPDDAPGAATIAVVDTGLFPSNTITEYAATDTSVGMGVVDEGVDLEQDGDFPDALTGHGTFIASVIRQVNRDVFVLMAKAESIDGTEFVTPANHDPIGTGGGAATDELRLLDAVDRLAERAEAQEPPVAALSLSLGALRCPELSDEDTLRSFVEGNEADFQSHPRPDDTGSDEQETLSEDDVDALVADAKRDAAVAAVAVAAAVDLWTDKVGTPIYAAAGNSTPDLKLVPADLPDAMAVAAHDRNGERACWSGDGEPALGVDLVGIGAYVDSDGGDLIRGWVVWSGTSFAAPVAAAVAVQGGNVANVKTEPDADSLKCPEEDA